MGHHTSSRLFRKLCGSHPFLCDVESKLAGHGKPLAVTGGAADDHVIDGRKYLTDNIYPIETMKLTRGYIINNLIRKEQSQ